MKYVTNVGHQHFTIEINQAGVITVNGEIINVDMLQMEDTTMYSTIIGGMSHDIRMSEGDGVYTVQLSGEIFEVMVEDERTRLLAGLRSMTADMSGEAVIKAPMPGVVVEVCVSEGQAVESGEIVVILESMKMQNEFKSPRSGQVHQVRVAAGDKVDQNSVMITIA
jgi:biotin carboxyl carrier protein